MHAVGVVLHVWGEGSRSPRCSFSVSDVSLSCAIVYQAQAFYGACGQQRWCLFSMGGQVFGASMRLSCHYYLCKM